MSVPINANSNPHPPTGPWLFLGSGLLLIGAVILGLSREQRWGERTLGVHLITRNAAGLRAGQEVRISGLPVGKVKALALQPDASVTVELQLAQRYADLIGPRSVASQGQEGFVGDQFVVISPDPQGQSKRAKAGRLSLRYEEPIAISSVINQLAQTQLLLQATLRNTAALTAGEVPRVMGDMRTTLRDVGRLADTLEREMVSTAPQLRRTLQQVDRTGSNASKTATEAQRLLAGSRPALISTLEELQRVSTLSRRLLEGLIGLTGIGAGSGSSSPQAPATSPTEQPRP